MSDQRIKSLWFACFLLIAGCLSLVAGFAQESSYAKAAAAYHGRRLEEAQRWARQAVIEEPNNADAHFLLGELYYLRQDLSKAKESWLRALQLAPARKEIQERLARLAQESSLERNLARSDTYPFVVRFAQGQMPLDVGSLRTVLRDTYRLIGQQFNYFPEHPITVILYPESDFKKVVTFAHPASGIYDGKIRLPIFGGHPSTGSGVQAVLWHEYTHAIVHDLGKGRCPIWLNEGLARMEESRVTPGSLALAKKAAAGRTLFPWEKLWRAGYDFDPVSLELLYQESQLIAQYLVRRWGWEKLTKLLGHLGQGRTMQEAFREVYKADMGLVEKEWLESLRRLP